MTDLLSTIVNGTLAVGIGTNRLMNNTAAATRKWANRLPFRDQLKDVSSVPDSEVHKVAGLDWRAVPMKVGIIGRTETREAKGYQGIVRSDNAELLSITSDSFKIHQNNQIIGDMAAMAQAGGAKIALAGPIDGGRRIASVVRLDGSFGLPNKRPVNTHAGPVDDTTELFAVISGGHEVGTPYKIRGIAMRLWCANGAYMSEASNATLTLTHRLAITADVLRRVALTFDAIRRQFEQYADVAGQLAGVDANEQQNRLYVAELLQAGSSRKVAEKLGLPDARPDQVWAELADEIRGRRVMDALIRESDKLNASRKAGALLEAIMQQDGRNGDTLWNTYNGVTWHVDHVQGRTDESGVDSALFGEGALLKERALDVARGFAGVA
jgi:hypothetical protein